MKHIAGMVFCLLLAACASVPDQSADNTSQEIHRIIESFRTSMIERDRSKFLNLFLHEGITWQGVMDDPSLARLQLKLPKAVKAPVNRKNTPASFIDNIVKDSKRNEEAFSNILINTDGDVASVFFDYVYLEDSRETNHGKEIWLMVRTGSGWKIASVVWSEIDPVPSDAAAKSPGA